jgi:hypothetical protein
MKRVDFAKLDTEVYDAWCRVARVRRFNPFGLPLLVFSHSLGERWKPL